MNPEHLSILYVSQMPASPPRFGAQARVHGLMTQLARRHDLTAVMLIDDEFDVEECRRAMQAYCREVVLIPNPYGREGLAKRLLQLRSLASIRSFERLRVTVPALQRALDRVLRAQAVRRRQPGVPIPWSLRPTPGSTRREAPALVVDSHEIAYDLARQFARAGGSLGRRLYAGANWRKLRREELGTYRDADGVYLCSAVDERRLLDQVPGGPHRRSFPTRQTSSTTSRAPRTRRRTAAPCVYFGLLSTVPNVDGVIHFVQDIWPRVAEAHPEARCKIIGGRPPPSLLALAGPRIELTGFVSDLRPHLAAAAAVVVPLRLGGGTRLKIVEGMAMGKAIVSTTLGAEGIEAVPGRDLLVEDQPAAFADAVSRSAGRSWSGGAHRPVGEAAGGAAIFLERGGPGAGGLLPPDPGGAAREGSAHRSRADRPAAPRLPEDPAGRRAGRHLRPLARHGGGRCRAVRDPGLVHRSPGHAGEDPARRGPRHHTADVPLPAGHGLVRRRRSRDRGEAGHLDLRGARRRWSSAPSRPGVTSSRTTTTSSTMLPRRFCDASSPASSGR